MITFIDALGLRGVHLGGSSMGGFIAAEFAGRYPDRVASLWLLSSPGTAAAIDCDMVRRYTASGEMSLLLHAPDQFDELLREATVRPPFQGEACICFSRLVCSARSAWPRRPSSRRTL